MSVSRRQMLALNHADTFTKRHLRVDPEGENSLAVTESGETIAIAAFVYDRDGKVTPEKLAEKAANLERMVDSWNACLSIPSAMLKSPGSFAALYEAVRFMVQDRLKCGEALSSFDISYLQAVLDRFEPESFPVEGKHGLWASAIRILSDLNIDDDITPMYDIAAKDVAPVDDYAETHLGDFSAGVGTVSGSFPLPENPYAKMDRDR